MWLVLLFSCTEQGTNLRENPTQLDQYFPLSDFVQSQIERLDGKKVRKTLVLGERKEEVTQQLDQVGWRKELDLFIQSDINKASLATSYTTEETADRIVHRLIDGELGDVQEMKVIKDGDTILELSFTYRKESFFYLSEGAGSMTVNPETGLVASYEVSGRQKVWFLPANTMELSAVVNP
ncbi:MAG: hypothetical protein JJU34_14200 [Lunatimonas sp.]|uniref:hypothetical protein n=1 Tax=Lunatimonas sp. TaxID=2060141 RepID=UPI00263B7B57|nr:hypothetical protein [Lunatimonas sp.]MCC5938426.1 hypothetical protein [Lunatimonas sp.]